MKTRILWIEDDALVDLRNLTGPIYISGKYDLVLAFDATEGMRYLMDEEFQVVIVDIRIPPGNNPQWIKIYNDFDKYKVKARLGIHLLQAILKFPNAKYKMESEIPLWINPTKFGVFSVENLADVVNELRQLNINIFEQKTATSNHKILLEIVEKILNEQRHKVKLQNESDIN